MSPRADHANPDPFAVVDEFYASDGRVDEFWPPGVDRDPNLTKPVKLRQGTRWWGHKKIAAKHGWGPFELAQTQDALLAPEYAPSLEAAGPNPIELSPGRWAYYSPWVLPDGTHCTTVVVVRYNMDLAAAADPKPKHILTSFAYVGWHQWHFPDA